MNGYSFAFYFDDPDGNMMLMARIRASGAVNVCTLTPSSQTLREIFRAHLNDLVGFLQRADNLE